ncbi:MAG: NAD(P)H-dependent glycerol-3-phosphate dehydrogenase [Pseudomonadota bacterium]
MTSERFCRLGVIGGGAWGTALAQQSARNGNKALIWAREPEVVEAINGRAENDVFLPGVSLTENVTATSKFEDVAACEALIFVAPAQFARGMFEKLAGLKSGPWPVLLCSKGIELTTGLLLTDVLDDVWPSAIPAVLSGPSFAKDVAEGKPTAVALACQENDLGHRWVATIGSQTFRPYLVNDLVGVELGGAVKNVIAIAAGAVDGAGLGESARAAIISRGYAEFRRIGAAMGANPQTMAGLSGLGDLILTATSERSRNMSLGQALGRGRTMVEIMGERTTVSEGIATAEAVVTLAKSKSVEVPVCEAVAALVSGRAQFSDLVAGLLARPFRAGEA